MYAEPGLPVWLCFPFLSFLSVHLFCLLYLLFCSFFALRQFQILYAIPNCFSAKIHRKRVRQQSMEVVTISSAASSASLS